jgi:hypothetical protein
MWGDMSPRPHGNYERTCKACGFQWEVERRLADIHPPKMKAKGRVGTPFTIASPLEDDHSELDEQAFEARVEIYEQTRRCPSCGVDDFTERPVTKARPIDDLAPRVEMAGPSRGQLSDDRKTFWDGATWIPTISKDGTMQWDGTHWVPN